MTLHKKASEDRLASTGSGGVIPGEAETSHQHEKIDLSWVLRSTPAPFAILSPLQFRGSQLTCTLESAMVRCTPDTLDETPWGGTQALAFLKLL